MKRFVLKSSIFVLPFIILFTFNKIFYNRHEGDLVRIGYLYANPSPKSKISSNYNLPKHYTLLSEIDLETNTKFDVIIIGDSFSEQDSLGYTNFLAHNGLSVLHIDRYISGDNPMQYLIQLLNSDFFDHISTDYILLESVERRFNQRNEKIDFDKRIALDSISNKIKHPEYEIIDYDMQFFSDALFKIPITNIQYSYKPKPKYSKTYKYKSNNTRLFSGEPDDILFFENEIDFLNIKNDSLSIIESIDMLDNIDDLVKKSSMKLIVLVCPDKYDLYFQYIKENSSLPKPLFFSIYDQAEKQYINIDSYKILSEMIIKGKDIYYYDDTHWSPKGAKIIADEISAIIDK